jgi:phenylacetate-CoA ligase
LSISTPVGRQAEWLGRLNPDYLLTYPTNLAALLRELRQRGITLPGLRQVRTIGETLSDDIRQACENQLKVDVADTYSSQEVGNIAIQCPMSGLYHVMSEYLLVEVLDDAGQPCVPGQTGRVVVTDLLNFATPLIRYEIGDYAEAGASCPCGRGLPTLRRIAGRERNMVLLPDGSRHWPLVGFQRFRQIAPIRQYQIIQHSLQAIEVRLVVDAPLDASQQSLLQDVIRQSLGYAFDLEFIFHHQEIPRSKNGKFEEFVCLIKNHS